eukprot:2188077-Alexandrium_andersonii.AAC.1
MVHRRRALGTSVLEKVLQRLPAAILRLRPQPTLEMPQQQGQTVGVTELVMACLLYTSDAADDM